MLYVVGICIFFKKIAQRVRSRDNALNNENIGQNLLLAQIFISDICVSLSEWI